MTIDYKLPNGKLLRISDCVLDIFVMHQQISFNVPESGGILLGRVFEKYIMIESASLPGEGDKRGILFFHRDKRKAQSIINKNYEESNGEIIYIGEWHTHCEKEPHPSFIDKWEIKRAFKKSKLNLKYLICIIVSSDKLLGNLWVGYYDGNKITQCQRVS